MGGYMNKRIFIAVFAVLILAVGIAVAFALFNSNANQEKKTVYYEYTIDTQYANIKTLNEKSKPLILKYSCAIQYTDASVEKLISKKINELKNEFRKYFMSKNAEQLNRVERVQEDLVEIATTVLGTESDTITDVFFTDFIMQ